VTTAGIVLAELPVPVGSELCSITSAPGGSLWFTGFAAAYVGTVTLPGTVSEVPFPVTASEANWITTGPDGNLWFVVGPGNYVGRLTP
jgi:virginiamycin B lyase